MSEFALPAEQEFAGLFSAWWEALDKDDREEFVRNGGGDREARFVCALELFDRMGHKNTAEAYALATGSELVSAKKNAYGPQGLKHLAVETLMVRLRHLTREEIWTGRLEHKYGKVLERLADEALAYPTINALKEAANSLSRYATFVRLDESEERKTRSKEAAARARAAFDSQFTGDLTTETAEQLVELIRERIGSERLRQLALADGQAQGADRPVLSDGRLAGQT